MIVESIAGEFTIDEEWTMKRNENRREIYITPFFIPLSIMPYYCGEIFIYYECIKKEKRKKAKQNVITQKETPQHPH